MGRIRKNLSRVAKTNPFQRQHFQGLESFEKWNGFEDFIDACPFTEKKDLVQDRLDHPPHGRNLTFPIEEYSKFNQTSGTQGKAMTWLDTVEDWKWMLGNWNRVLEAAGVEVGAVVFLPFLLVHFLVLDGNESATQRGCVCIPAGGQSTEQRLNGILNQKPSICFVPRPTQSPDEFAKDRGFDLSGHRLKSIIVAGETGGSLPAVRNRITSIWGKDLAIHDHYGMTEVGPVAYEKPGGQGGLRIILDSYYPEVIDPNTLQPVKDGEKGELVITTLGRTGCPVFRYRTGDLVVASCGLDNAGLPMFDLEGGFWDG